MSAAEKYLCAKELSENLRDTYGIRMTARGVRFALRAGVPRIGYMARLTALHDWLVAHPDFRPHAKRTTLSPVRML
jgi:hypothetical protein